jgi:hypothetical protein
LTAISGRTVMTVNITEAQSGDCVINLEAGLNLVSSPCFLQVGYLQSELSAFPGLVSIHTYDRSRPAHPWRAYNPSLPAMFTQDQIPSGRDRAYFVDSASGGIFNITQILPVVTNIALVPGWNLVGYPSLSDRNASAAFASIAGHYTAILKLNSSTQAYASYPANASNAFVYALSGEGYWINASSAATWVVFT